MPTAGERETSTARRRLGVGILGAGPVTQAIHLPTLSRLSEDFHVVKIMDVDPSVAASVAGRVGAESTTDASQIYGDPRIDVIAICSPERFHAEQVIAACRAGVKAVLCEKPFAVSADEATAIAQVATETGVPIVVGAMHAFDPGWVAATRKAARLFGTVHTIRSSIVLPPNARFEDFATEVVTRPVWPDLDRTDPAAVRGAIRGGVLGLAIHDLPLIRSFLPSFEDLEISRAQVIAPRGYAISGSVAGVTIDLRFTMTDSWRPEWLLEAFGAEEALSVAFTPSYVQAGSAVAALRTTDGLAAFGPYPGNGYQGEWEHLAGLARGEAEPIPLDRLIDDLRFALAVADAATAAATVVKEDAA